MSKSQTTTHPRLPWALLRAAAAVLAGVLVNIVAVGAIDAALRAAGAYPPIFQPMAEHLWATALSYRLVFGVVAGYVTASLAPSRPLRCATILGVIELALSGGFVVVNWSKPEFGPHWFAVAAVVTALPCAVLGGWLWTKKVAAARL